MKFIMHNSKKHQEIFEKEIIKRDANNYALIAAIYLFTADNELWKVTKDHIEKNSIEFDKIKLDAIYMKGYILYCMAKDFYLGTRHITISDITDKQMVSPKSYKIICNVMEIKRIGKEAWC